ncbi:hypothetical protein AB0M20_30055, partial [Actinoplanes sp. NPDC051633]|uniref:hypothetical protein n=1 Tax=Actinoplanes sp. NPDC051633 TaxID=3155670 RepID=UPI003446D8BB
MMDLRDGLEQIAGRPVPPNSAELMADLGRGRKALRKRRTLQAAGGSLFAVAAAVAAISLSGVGITPGTAGDRPPAATGAATLKLVD